MQPNWGQEALASERTLLAAERTFSAWIRTGLAAIRAPRSSRTLRRVSGRWRRILPTDDRITQPSSAIATAFDPFYGIFYPVEVPTTTVLGSYSQNKGGLNGGAGIAVRLAQDGNATLFAESRYHYIYTAPVRTAMLPVTVGFRCKIEEE